MLEGGPEIAILYVSLSPGRLQAYLPFKD